MASLSRLALPLLAAASFQAAGQPQYTPSGDLVRPANYREWVFLSSGLGMTYGPAAAGRNMPPRFDNVFVKPEAYRAFLDTGRWPDKTVFILEVRYSQSHGSINKGGSFQTDIAALEAAVKDESRFPEKWAYFDFATSGGTAADSGKRLPQKAGCYACHSANGAVENTFVQFYPTLLAVAEAKGTLKPSFRAWTPSPARLYHTITTEGWPSAKTAFDRARAEEPDAAVLREPALKRLAGQLARAGKTDEAISVLEYAMSLYPASANLQDGLAEAYEAAGRNSEALKAERRAMELLAQDASLSSSERERFEKAARERMARLENKR